MKLLGILTIICIYAIGANAQEINLDSIRGTWNYESPKAKTKLSYKFDFENKFTSITEREKTETQINGAYAFDKVVGLNRLIITTTSKEDGTRTHTLYYFIKFIGTDTLKLHRVNDKQMSWLRETGKNTMIFVRNKEKTKQLTN